jgi:hypothetical protein
MGAYDSVGKIAYTFPSFCQPFFKMIDVGSWLGRVCTQVGGSSRHGRGGSLAQGGAGSVSSIGWVDHWVQVMELKGIHLALEVKTSFGSSMPVMGSSMESSTFGIAGKKRRKTCTQKVKSKA